MDVLVFDLLGFCLNQLKSAETCPDSYDKATLRLGCVISSTITKIIFNAPRL